MALLLSLVLRELGEGERLVYWQREDSVELSELLTLPLSLLPH